MILTIEAPTAEELKAKVLEVAKSFYDEMNGTTAVSLDSTGPAANGAAPAEKEKRKRRTKVEMAEATAANTTTAAVATEVAPEASKSAKTKADVINALSKVNAEKGMLAAKGVLAKFDCQRISELPETAYAEFVKTCNAQ